MTGPFARPVGVLALCVSVLAGCVPADSEVVPKANSGSSTPSPSSGHHHSTTQPLTASQTRLLMERLLGHHAILMVRLMRGRIDGEDEFVRAARGALERDTEELADAVANFYDDSAGTRFATLWTTHVDSLAAYSRALADEDSEAQSRAEARLDRYSTEYGSFIEELTDGTASAGAVAEGVSAHIHHMLMATDEYKEGDYDGAFQAERTAYAAMFGQGKALSGAAVRQTTGELAAGFDSPGTDLRSALGRLLGEHVELAFDATRAIVTGSAAAEAAGAALNANTSEIIEAMQGSLGAETAGQFSRIWAAHIDALVKFAVAVADDDDAAQSRARATLDQFPRRLGSVLPAISGGRVAARTVIVALQEHDEQLLQQVTAFAAKDYATSHELSYAGYDHMFAIADTLAVALEGHAVGSAPRGGASTGGGGTADH